uniref:Cadherin 26, tandem duplicate 1 n=1 Tax=Myripristis murdjan TaxID=586833 RepID=A0A667ZAV0_9TELE
MASILSGQHPQLQKKFCCLSKIYSFIVGLLQRSKRRWVLSTIVVTEEDPGPFPKEMFNDKSDAEMEKHKFRIKGMGVTEEPLGVFSINDRNGSVYVHKPIDREKYKLFHIEFDILDRTTGEFIDKTLAFDVNVKDINDNAPFFKPNVIDSTVFENIQEGYLPSQLQAWDMDEYGSNNSAVVLSVLKQEPSEPKIDVEQVIGDRKGQLTFKGCFDYDKAKKYNIIVQAKDLGSPSLSSTAVVNLYIHDSNTHLPTFKDKQVTPALSGFEVLRVAVEDKDTPNTPGWRAKYFFIKGNEEDHYKLETDPITNEGILTVIKGKDFERTMLTSLQIGVENEEPLFVCKDNSPNAPVPPPNSVNITIKVIDVNDPPQFDQVVADVYQREEEEPGRVLYTPKATDVEKNKIRYELIEDPADWVTIDPETGKITSAKKMDRESPHVNENNIYRVLIIAIDDGEPPATGTNTIHIHLGDINDNLPKATRDHLLCGNKDNKIMVQAMDDDAPPYSGPFTFSLGGNAGGLVSLKSLPYGNYSVPLVILDQQGMKADAVVDVVVCDCGDGDMCRGSLPVTSSFGAPVLLLVFMCQCKDKTFQRIPLTNDEGNQTLIKYNEEGGGAECKVCLLCAWGG